VKFHRDVAPGLRFLFMDNTVYEEAKIYVAVRKAKMIPKAQLDYVDAHIHTVDSLYLFIGENDDLTGLSASVAIEEKSVSIESPMSVYIPRNIPHTYKLTRGRGIFVSILLSGDYNGNTFNEKSRHGP
jgi:2-isopropylmalate synthase